jgi:nicotinamidase-related amidase
MTASPSISNSILLVVDVQRGFISEYSMPILPAIREILANWQALGGLTVMTQFVNAIGSPYVEIIGWTEMMPGDPKVEFDSAVADLSDRATVIVRKSGYSSLTPEAISLLNKNGLKDICIVGLDTESCVLATAIAAFDQGYTPWILTDAVASHAGPEAHAAGLLVAGRNIGLGQLITTAQVLTTESGGHSSKPQSAGLPSSTGQRERGGA